MINPIRRNDPCPCGSGKRYKQCCGSVQAAGPQNVSPVDVESLSQIQEMGLQHFNAARYLQAEALYNKVLQADPENADALHVLGVIKNRTGRPAEAAELISKAIAINPQVSVYYLNLGNAFLELQRLDDAVTQYRKAISVRPDLAEAYLNLGFVFGEQGRQEEALFNLEKSVALKPGLAEAHYNLGHLLQTMGRTEDAISSYEHTLALDSSHVNALLNLGVLWQEGGTPERSLEYFDRALAIQPDFAMAYYNRGKSYEKLGRLPDAAMSIEKALVYDPNMANAYHDLGVMLHNKEKDEQAKVLLERAKALAPDDPDVHYNLGNVLYGLGQFKNALTSYRRALELKPDLAVAQMNLAGTFMALALMDEAVTHFERALLLDHEMEGVHSNGLLALQYASGFTPQEIFDKHRAFGLRNESVLAGAICPHGNVPDPARKLKIGFVSPDFRNHSVAYFMEPVLAHLDHGQFELFAYYSHEDEDVVTQRFRSYCEHWLNIEKMSDDEVAERIRQDGIDVLVDVAGHTGGNRLLVFARKPAPVQVTWLGHPNTTGLKSMDYRITDAYAEPSGMTENLNTETLWRMPEVFCCYTPCAAKPERRAEAALAVKPPPMLQNGYATFGCFNNIAKVSPPTIALWARVLHAIPGSKLMLEAHKLEVSDLQEEIMGRFAAHGIGLERLILKGRVPAQQYVLYHEVDVALDPFPCSGGTTTFDALWMGVPVVTLAGQTFVSRMGVSLLSNLGLGNLVAETEDGYVETVRRLVSDPQALNAMRLGQREKMERSPLMDAPRFVKNMETAFRGMWRKWCEQQAINEKGGDR